MKITISKEVQKALDSNIPVVALESTIITHGMPYPKNVEMVNLVSAAIRSEGAIPATIAFIKGECIVGIDDQQIEELAKSSGVVKVSRRDIPIVTAMKLDGGTTVAATMIVAEKAGIKVFATGGIGGVHRGATETFDISADLEELSRTNVTVVCAGAKAILDLPLTLEYLETKGVPVLGYKTKSLPAFYTKDSPYKVDYCIENPEEIANIMHHKWGLNLNGGILVTNPVPSEYSLEFNKVEEYIQEALKQAKEANIQGKETTPFLLAKITELSKGESLKTNIELVVNNARLGAKIAVAYSKLEGEE